jgi:hypothetical protein
MIGLKNITKEKLQEVCEKSFSKSQCVRELGLKASSGNITAFTKKVKLLDIDISHFTGQGWNVGGRYTKVRNNKKYSNDEVFVENCPLISSNPIKRRIINDSLIEYKCQSCDLGDIWNNKKLVLQLDHVNGNNMDNRLENLRFLCPNCHTQTDTFNGRNANLGVRIEKREIEIRKFRETVSQITSNGNPEPNLLLENGIIDTQIPKVKKRKCAETLHGLPKPKRSKPNCERCGKECKSYERKFCSYECSNIEMAKHVPSKDEILNAFQLHLNFLQVGKYFNVSDNAVRKWCIKYDILDMVKRKSKE